MIRVLNDLTISEHMETSLLRDAAFESLTMGRRSEVDTKRSLAEFLVRDYHGAISQVNLLGQF